MQTTDYDRRSRLWFLTDWNQELGPHPSMSSPKKPRSVSEWFTPLTLQIEATSCFSCCHSDTNVFQTNMKNHLRLSKVQLLFVCPPCKPHWVFSLVYDTCYIDKKNCPVHCCWTVCAIIYTKTDVNAATSKGIYKWKQLRVKHWKLHPHW